MRKPLTLIVYSLNLLALLYLVVSYFNGNDKAIFILILGPPFLAGINFLFGGIASAINTNSRKPFFHSAIGISILYLPILFIVPQFG
jgi:hypothetical protein